MNAETNPEFDHGDMAGEDDVPARVSRVDRRFAIFVVVFPGLVGIVTVIAYYTTSEPPYDAFDRVMGRDFINIWVGSMMAQAGAYADIFDPNRYYAFLQEVVGEGFPPHLYLYLPHSLFMIYPFASLPYMASYALFSALGLALYLVAFGAGRRWRDPRLVALALGPAAFINLLTGQTGFINAALFVGGMQLIDRRPVLAGVLFGLLTYKPQLGIVIPVALVAARLWTPFLSAAVTAIAVTGLSALVFGVEPWITWFEINTQASVTLIEEGSGPFVLMSPTLFMAGRTLGLPLGLCYGLQAASAVVALAGVWLTFRRSGDREMQIALAMVAVFLVSPYVLNYDMTILNVAVVLVAAHVMRDGPASHEGSLLALVWVLPLLTVPLNYMGVTVAPLILIVFFVVVYRRANGWQPRQEGAAAPAG